MIWSSDKNSRQQASYIEIKKYYKNGVIRTHNKPVA